MSRNIRNLCHLDLIVSAIIRVVWKGSCYTSDSSGPGEDALCSEAGRHASFLYRLTQKYHLLSERMELVSLLSHRLCDCQGRQEGVLLPL